MEITPLPSSSISDPSYTLINVEDYEIISMKYDVFLNFRGEDTRKNILGHLRSALTEKGIKTFVDDDQLERGQYISPQLVQAIEDSRSAVIVLSPNYASSSWCLDELVHILDCMKKRGQIVIPVFCHVDPSDVRKQAGSFGEAFDKHEKNFEDDLERVNKWRVALREVTSLVGLDLRNCRDEANFVREIVGEVTRKLLSIKSTEILELETSEENVSCQSTILKTTGRITWGVLSIILCFLFFFLVFVPLFFWFVTKVAEPLMDAIIGDPVSISSHKWTM